MRTGQRNAIVPDQVDTDKEDLLIMLKNKNQDLWNVTINGVDVQVSKS